MGAGAVDRDQDEGVAVDSDGDGHRRVEVVQAVTEVHGELVWDPVKDPVGSRRLVREGGQNVRRKPTEPLSAKRKIGSDLRF